MVTAFKSLVKQALSGKKRYTKLRQTIREENNND
jgi:hypothetical protein